MKRFLHFDSVDVFLASLLDTILVGTPLIILCHIFHIPFLVNLLLYLGYCLFCPYPLGFVIYNKFFFKLRHKSKKNDEIVVDNDSYK